MQSRLIDRFTPTTVMLVSRGWVIDRVNEIDGIDEATRHAWVDELCLYEPPRRHGMRNNVIVWVAALGAAMVADAAGLPGWSGFVAALLALTAMARVLAKRVLRWRLAQLQRPDG
jgi:hypothetical protein